MNGPMLDLADFGGGTRLNVAGLFLIGQPRLSRLAGTLSLDEWGQFAAGPAPEWPLGRKALLQETNAPDVFAVGATGVMGWCPGCSIEDGIRAAGPTAKYLRDLETAASGRAVPAALMSRSR